MKQCSECGKRIGSKRSVCSGCSERNRRANYRKLGLCFRCRTGKLSGRHTLCAQCATAQRLVSANRRSSGLNASSTAKSRARVKTTMVQLHPDAPPINLSRAYNMKFHYGLDVGGAKALLAKQGGVCGLCREPFVDSLTMVVDHCHASGKVRGIIHNSCNTGLGLFAESAERLRAAIDYLERASNGN